MRQPANHAAPRDSLAATPVAPPVIVNDPARQHGPVGFETLPNGDEAKFVETAERGQVRTAEAVLGSSVGHVEVFQMRRVGTFILGRPRPLPGERRADRSTPSIVKSPIRPYRDTRAVLPFDDLCATNYATVLAMCEAAGLPISTANAQIAAICLSHDAQCATRNVKDFAHTGVDLINPWSEH